ncbi:uncharacterized protein LOC117790983 [Drosophila innubila]|uniref:uncharacterized protein LOC117790983 n=1 Tax=Drosophila innubila TaxID=198719 RepID=UPI00148D67DF|nr:uncharacterized protein LOC117790983 [Drosophila innubila]
MFQSNQALQKEQADLYALEKKLVQNLPKIQEALNSLKVEELHLKSQLVNQKLSQVDPSILNVSAAPSQHIPAPHDQDQANHQEIDLDLFVSKLQQFDVENDSD